MGILAPEINRPCITAVSIDIEELRDGNLSAEIEFCSPYCISRPIGGIVISTPSGVPIWGSNGRFHRNEAPQASAGRGVRLAYMAQPLISEPITFEA